MRYAVCVPTYNGGSLWQAAARALKTALHPEVPVITIDSGSSDGTDACSQQMGFEVLRISKKDFDHGATRQLAVDYVSNHYNINDSCEIEIIVFLTQDSVLESSAIERLLAGFSDDPLVMVAYGRQLPRERAGALEAHARLYNYPAKSAVKDKSMIDQMGFKTVFSSNSFAAYRISAFESLGGFLLGAVCSEDVHFAAKVIMSGGRVAYVADAITRHSHGFTVFQEFKRSFDIGAFHTMEPWIMDTFGGVYFEGFHYFFSQVKYSLLSSPLLVFKAFCSCAMRYVGYALGRRFRLIQPSIRPALGANSSYWLRQCGKNGCVDNSERT